MSSLWYQRAFYSKSSLLRAEAMALGQHECIKIYWFSITGLGTVGFLRSHCICKAWKQGPTLSKYESLQLQKLASVNTEINFLHRPWKREYQISSCFPAIDNWRIQAWYPHLYLFVCNDCKPQTVFAVLAAIPRCLPAITWYDKVMPTFWWSTMY